LRDRTIRGRAVDQYALAVRVEATSRE
jgi:hypothetical protein